MMYLSTVQHMVRACLILILTASTVHSWNLDYYYDDTPYFFNGDEHDDSTQYKTSRSEQSSCNCIKLKECTALTTQIYAAPKPLSVGLMKDIREKGCGYAGIDPLVCCPNVLPRSFRETSSEKPWVWDVSNSETKPTKAKPTNLFNRWNADGYWRPNDVHVPTQKTNKNFYSRKTKKYHFFAFEDPRTFRNCPPSFSPDFHIPPHFRDVKPYKNFHHTSTSYESNGYDSNSVDNDHNFIFPSSGNAAGDVVIFPSRAANYPLDKLSLINPVNCGISINARIIGGDEAAPGQFPWMARLAYRNRTSQLVSYRCSGSVISNKYVLTAAHCVTNLVDDLELVYVRLGELDSRTNLCDNNRDLCAEPQDYEIQSIVHHPSYDNPKYANDVALIRLLQVTNSSFISPLCLPLGSYAATAVNLNEKMGIVAGWGVSSLGNVETNPILQYVELPIVDTRSCADSYARFSANSRTPIIINENQICAQGTANRDACQGDSGGPLVRKDSRTGRYILLGLVSFGPRTCGIPSFPGVYSRTSSYLNWILNNIHL